MTEGRAGRTEYPYTFSMESVTRSDDLPGGALVVAGTMLGPARGRSLVSGTLSGFGMRGALREYTSCQMESATQQEIIYAPSGTRARVRDRSQPL